MTLDEAFKVLEKNVQKDDPDNLELGTAFVVIGRSVFDTLERISAALERAHPLPYPPVKMD